jgi:Reverse transcriptase (RNA-dependent DNA polymerase)
MSTHRLLAAQPSAQASAIPIAKISDLLRKLKNFRYATAINLSMGYYHIPLDKAAQCLCTTVLPWGKFRYMQLPMGVSVAPDIFQSIMMEILGDLEFVRVYMDDILIISNGTFTKHMQQLETVPQRLEDKGFRTNVCKCFFAQGVCKCYFAQVELSNT